MFKTFITIFSFPVIFFTIFFLLAFNPALAANEPDKPKFTIPTPVIQFSNKIEFKEPIKGESVANKDGSQTTYYYIPWIGQYVQGVYNYAIGIVGIVAAIAMVIGGFIWMTAGGNASKVGEAQAWIGSSVIGLALALGSFLIMTKISPTLTQFKPIRMAYITPKEIVALQNAMARYSNCDWKHASEECTGQSLSDTNFCQQQKGDPPENVKSGIAPKCCCTIAPLTNCSWNDICNPNEGLADAPKDSCGTYKDGPKNCCCPETSAEFKNQPHIAQLDSLWNCVKSKVPWATVFSVVDNSSSWQQHLSSCCGGNCSGCVHACNSCHYGGSGCGGSSKAIDIHGANGANLDRASNLQVVSAIQQCSSGLSDVDILSSYVTTSRSGTNDTVNYSGHDTHVHVSVNCNGDGGY